MNAKFLDYQFQQAKRSMKYRFKKMGKKSFNVQKYCWSKLLSKGEEDYSLKWTTRKLN